MSQLEDNLLCCPLVDVATLGHKRILLKVLFLPTFDLYP
jgi:hypothetical protein